MQDQLKKYSDEAYEMVQFAANDIGQRLPGCDGEKKFHEHLSQKFREIGLEPKTEKFIFAPRSSIGGLPYAGWGGIMLAALLVLGTLGGRLNAQVGAALHFFAALYGIVLWVWVILSVFKYKTWFDWCFKQEVSHNTYAQLTPADGRYDYTVYLSGHTDTSWTLKHSAAKGSPAFIYIKIGIGAVSVGLTTALALVCMVCSMGLAFATSAEQLLSFGRATDVLFYVVTFCSPALAVGAYMLTLYNEKNPRVASPGAMDNATGVAIAYETIKFFKDNPDLAPAHCRIIAMGCGAEEAGLRGSINFVRAHKDDGMLQNAYHINIDSIADKDHFEVIHGDAWLCPHFDKDMTAMAFEAMKEAGIQKPGDIANPVGGCDSTPFQKAGVKSITVAAQDPAMTYYYHTLYDVPERFEKSVVAKGLEVVVRLVQKIGESRENI